jgi:hypothetical protein
MRRNCCANIREKKRSVEEIFVVLKATLARKF